MPAEVAVDRPSAGRGEPAGAPRPQRLGLALVVIAAAQLMVVLDATIVNVALPHIHNALHFSGTNLEWCREIRASLSTRSLVSARPTRMIELSGSVTTRCLSSRPTSQSTSRCLFLDFFGAVGVTNPVDRVYQRWPSRTHRSWNTCSSPDLSAQHV